MEGLETVDIFTVNPFRGIKNAGLSTYRKGWHWESDQAYACFYYVIKGTVSLRLQDEEYALGADDVFFLGSGERAVISNGGDGDLSCYFVSFYCNGQVALDLGTVYRSTGLGSLFKRIMEAHRSGARLCRLNVAQLFLKLVWLLAAQTEKEQETLPGTAKLHAAVEYIHIHYDRKISLMDLCNCSGYSPAHLRRLFVRQFGVSPQEYILRKRMEVAKEALLDIPEKSMEEVAESLGLCSASYFCKLFKQSVGMTPAEFRNKENRKKSGGKP